MLRTAENNWNSIKREDEWTELHWHLLAHTSALVLFVPPKNCRGDRNKRKRHAKLNKSFKHTCHFNHTYPLRPALQHSLVIQAIISKRRSFYNCTGIAFLSFFFFLFCFEADKILHVTAALCGLLDLQQSCTGSHCVQGWFCTACTSNPMHIGHHTLQCCIPATAKFGNCSPHWTCYINTICLST